MKILYLTNYFPPEIATGPHLAHELAESLVQEGNEVTVVTGFPRYNLTEMPEKYRGRLLFREEMDGMQVLRINALNFYGRSVLSRGLVQLLNPPLLGLQAMCASRPDVVYTISPPLLMGVLAFFTARRFRVPCVVNVQDLFPQTMIDLGVLKNWLLIKIFQQMERFVYRAATAITVMSEGNREFVIRRGAAPQKVHTVFNWVDVDAIQPAQRMNDFRRQQGLDDQFVALFAGTMGVSQGLEVVIDAARELAHEPNLLFLLIGDGIARHGVEVRAAGLKNVRFLPMQSKEKYPQLLAAADACLVTIKPEVLTPTVPSKIATIMAAGRPIVASLPLGDAPKLIQAAGSGILAPAGDAKALAAAILELKNNPQAAQRMGQAGRCYAEKHLSRPASVRRTLEVLKSALQEPRR